MTIPESDLMVANAPLAEAIREPRIAGVSNPPEGGAIVVWTDGEAYQLLGGDWLQLESVPHSSKWER